MLSKYCPVCDEEDIKFIMGDYPRPDQLKLCEKHKEKILVVEIKDKSYLRTGTRMWLIDEKKLKQFKWFKIPKEKIAYITTKDIEKLRDMLPVKD